MRTFSRQILALAAFAALAAAFSGCVVIKSNSSVQRDAIGDVQVTTTFCSSDTNSNDSGYSPSDSACQGASHGGNSNLDTGNGSYQLLLAYRIPTAAQAPDTIVTTNPSGANKITFSPSSGYTAALQSSSPAPAGEKWVGFMSGVVNYTTAGGQYATVSPRFVLAPGADGSPFAGPFTYRVAVGSREVGGSNLATRPVSCGSPVTSFNVSDNTICVDDPNPSGLATDLQQPTQDFGILDPPGPQSVSQGNVARLRFETAYSGDGNPAPDFDLSASTDVPGATAIPSTPTINPDDDDTAVRVIMRVPADAQPGSYGVTLTAALPNGQTRTSTHPVLITPTTVRCNESAPTITGTRGDDVLVGTPGPDVIAGYAGNDQILGLGGNDVICAGRGNDTLRGGAGNDQLAGRRGDDRLTGGSGHNVIDPGPGKDRFIQ